MKRIKLLFVTSISILALYACKKDALDVNVDLPGLNATFIIDTTITAGEKSIITTKSINIDSLAKTKNTTANLLKSLKATNLRFNILETDADLNFNMIDSGSVTISNPGKNNSLVFGKFSTKNINPSSKQFDVIPADVDILTYAKEPTTTFECKIRTKGAVTKKVTVKMTVTAVAVIGAK